MSERRSWLYSEKQTDKRLKIASVAMQCDADPAVNRARMIQMIRAIKSNHPDVELVVFGELSLCWYSPTRDDYNQRVAEPIPGETTRALAKLAADHALFICFGLLETSGGSHLHNAQVLINPQGEVQTIHRKWNLKTQERLAGWRPGPQPVTLTTIKGIKTGIVVCSDAAHPRTMWELMKHRLDLILLSLADDRDEGLFMAHFNARMYDAWVVTANRYGDENGHFWNGHIVVSDPLGTLRSRSEEKTGYLVYELRFDIYQPAFKQLLRIVIVKAALPFLLLRHWKRIGDYF